MLKDIDEYCKLNNIADVKKFIDECTLIGFNIKKYGNRPLNKSIVVITDFNAPVHTPYIPLMLTSFSGEIESNINKANDSIYDE